MGLTNKLTLAALLLIAAASQAIAATPAKTNYVQSLTILIGAYEDRVPHANGITRINIIKDLNTVTDSAGSNLFHFSASARLILKRDSATNSAAIVFVRDSHPAVDTDVNSFFNKSTTEFAQFANVIHTVDVFDYNGSHLSFSLTGFTQETVGQAIKNGPVLTKQFTFSGAGRATIGGTRAPAHGTITLGGGRLE